MEVIAVDRHCRAGTCGVLCRIGVVGYVDTAGKKACCPEQEREVSNLRFSGRGGSKVTWSTPKGRPVKDAPGRD